MIGIVEVGVGDGWTTPGIGLAAVAAGVAPPTVRAASTVWVTRARAASYDAVNPLICR
jgi:hypothetical protein